MSDILLEASQVSHRYGNYQAIAPVELTLQRGEIVVLTGPNGAGKTTLLLCLSGLLHPTTGRILVEGFDLYGDERQAKQRLMFVPDVPRFYTELTAWEHLRFIAFANGAQNAFEERAGALMREFGLWEARDLFPHNYSRGMRLKLGLAMAFMRPFRVLLLDEPTSALDPEGVELVRDKLAALGRQGAAVLLSSHDPSLVQGLSDRVWRIRQGNLEKE